MKLSFLGFVCCLLLAVFAPALQAGPIYPFEIFTDNGNFAGSAYLNLYVEVSEVSDAEANLVDFTFYNGSSIESCIAGIYFDDGTLLRIVSAIGSEGVSFSLSAKPRNLPGGNMLEPPFVTTVDFSIDSDPPVSRNGINNPSDPGDPAEWLRITFETNGLFQDVLDELNNGTLRIGTHIIGLSDGSSESAVNGIPEPATVMLLGLGALSLIRGKKKT